MVSKHENSCLHGTYILVRETDKRPNKEVERVRGNVAVLNIVVHEEFLGKGNHE